MVMPLSLSPPHGVTLICRMCKGRVETLAEFLLNPRLCGLRLNIQVHREQKNDRYAKNRTNADQK